MNRIFHIFRKDAIRLWPQASVFCALLAANAWAERWYPHDAPNRPMTVFSLMLLLPLACSVLLIALIHEERLVGDSQYWLSRPIPRRELIAAKILFVLAFVNLPVFLYQAVMVVSGLLPLFPNWTNFLWLQLFFTAIDILPILALASVTKNMAQAVLAVVAVAAAAVGLVVWFSYLGLYASLAWIEVTLSAAVLAVGSVIVLLRQYDRRGTMSSLCLLVGTMALAASTGLLPHSARWAIQMKCSPGKVEPNTFSVSLVQDGRLHGRGRLAPDVPSVSLEFPISISQLSGMSIHAEGFRAFADAPTGDSWRPGWGQGNVDSDDGFQRMTVAIDHATYDRMKGMPVHFYGVLDLTVLANGPTIPLPERRFADVPGIGVCGSALKDDLRIFCNSLLPRARIQLIDNGRPGDGSPAVLAPYPHSASYSPITAVELVVQGQSRDHLDQVGLMIQKPIAYIQRPFDFGKVMLADYEVAYEDPTYLP